ncbi:MAG TPA: hypothetical protein VN372_02990 [Methanospirillum sp.]|nr:hypothetical protein [Methanospirillum sp.]
MSSTFQFISSITGVLILIVGFTFHWVGQIISLVNRGLAIRFGIWEKDNLPEYEVYEDAMAYADAILGWIYGVAGVGLVLGAPWGFTLACIPGVVLLYHSLCFWFWTRNQMRAGHQTAFTRNPARIVWFLANCITGVLALSVAWVGR